MIRVVEVKTSKKWSGKRVYLVGHRIHHGTTGCILATLGIVLAYHDRKDWKRWMADIRRELP